MSRYFAKNDRVVERQVRDEHLLVPLGSGSARLDCLYTLNETAGFIWRRAIEGLSDEQIALALAEDYDSDAATVRCDVRCVLDELVALGALNPIPANGSSHGPPPL